MVYETIDRSISIKVIIYIKYLSKDKDGVWRINIDYLDLIALTSQSALNIKVIFVGIRNYVTR